MPSQPRKDFDKEPMPIQFGQWLVLLSAEGFFTTIPLRNVVRGAIDDLKGCFVTGLVVVAPGAHTVVAEQDSSGSRILLDQGLNHQPHVEPRALPGNINQLITIDFLAKALLID